MGGCRYKKAKSNIENKNALFLSKITLMEKTLLDKLMHGLDHDFAAMQNEQEEREESIEPEVKREEEKETAKAEERQVEKEVQ